MHRTSNSQPASPLPDLTVEGLRELTDEKSFERGVGYYRDGAVRDIVLDRGRVLATVMGTSRYRVELSMAGDEVHYSCTCPVGRDDCFCKHCVAVAMACIEHDTDAESSGPDVPVISIDILAAELSRMEKEDLVAILVEHAVTDETLRQLLQHRVGMRAGGKLDPAPYRRMIDRALKDEDSFDYHDFTEFVDEIDRIISTLSALISDAASAAVVVQLVEHAIPLLEQQISSFAGSSWELDDLLDSFVDLHLRACLVARPDPVALAERLFSIASRSEWETFQNSYRTHAEVLGEAGRRRFRERAESEWKKLERIMTDRASLYVGNRSTLAAIMESIAAADRNVNLMVASRSKNLTIPGNYLEIVNILREAGRDDEALDWAERGVERFRDDPDADLARFLAEEYARRGRNNEALETAWNLYAARPGVETFTLLKEQATALRAWRSWRAKAVSLLEEQSERGASSRSGGHSSLVDPSTVLVRVLLGEGEAAAAWNAAVAYGCDDDAWLDLAGARASDHPEDAVAIYRSQIQRLTEGADREAYERIVELLRLMESVLRSEGRSDELAAEVAALRETCRRRRTFLAMLDEAFPDGGSGGRRRSG